MPQAGIYYLDPPPVQRLPTVPIPKQGDAPPRISRTLAQFMGLVLASWPTGLEPGLPQPDHHQSRIAPLTLTYGQPPPLIDGYQRVRQNVIVGAWPTGMEPGLPQPDYHEARIAPLTLTYGQQPPLIDGYQRVRQKIVLGAWEPPDPQPQRDPKNIVPLTLRYGDFPPPPTGMMDEDVTLWIVRAWLPPDPPPQRDPKNLAPLTLVYGDAPPMVSSARDLDIVYPLLTLAWQPPDPLPTIPQRGYVVPLTLVYGQQPPRADGYQRVRQNIIAGAWPTGLEPGLPQPDHHQSRIAPLTLVYGQQPPLYTAKLQSYLTAAALAWQPADPQPQRDAKNFAPLVLIVIPTPQPAWSAAGFMVQVLSSWPTGLEPGLPQPDFRRARLAPLSLVYGQPPPPTYGMFDADVCGSILRAWLPPDPPPQRDAKNIAPLTLKYGDQPPPGGGAPLARQAAIVSAWLTPDPAPATLYRYVVQPPLLVAQPPYVRSWQAIVLAGWQADTTPTPRSSRNLAPLTLVYGQQPPKPTIAKLMAIIAASDPASPQFQLRRTPLPPSAFTNAGLLLRRRRTIIHE